MLGRKGAQPGKVACAQRLQVAQHQRGDAVTHGQFDLRQAVTLVHAADELTQRQQHRAHARRQHGAHLHVGHVARLAFVKADQHRALLRNEAHREAGTVAVTPGRPLDRPQDALGPHLGQVPQVVLQHTLLHRHLRPDVQVLHFATAARA